MATYGIQGNQATMSSTYKGVGATWCSATLKRHKWYEIIVGATGNPNSTDTYVQIDVGRLTGTTSIAGTSWVPTATDPADGAALTVALVNVTTEPAAALISATSSLLNFGINQRNTTRWISSQESQYLIAPATTLNGLYMRALSNAYTTALAGQVTILE